MGPHLWAVIAAVLWGGLLLCSLAILVAVNASRHGRRTLALSLLALSTIGTLGFSFAAGFSIGRFTVAIPVLLIGYAAAMGRGVVPVAASLIGAAVTYLACSWFLTPLVLGGGPLALVFDLWAIPLYVLLALIAFGWAFARPPKPIQALAPYTH